MYIEINFDTGVIILERDWEIGKDDKKEYFSITEKLKEDFDSIVQYKIEEIDPEQREETIDEVTKKLYNRVVGDGEPEDFIFGVIEEAIKAQPQGNLMELSERLKNERATIKKKDGCYALMIGGKSGPPIEIHIAGIANNG